MLSYTPNMALFSFQRSTTLGGGRVSLTCNNPGTPREKLLQAGDTQPHRRLPAPPTRLPAIVTVSPLQGHNALAGRGLQDDRNPPRWLHRVLHGRNHLEPYPEISGRRARLGSTFPSHKPRLPGSGTETFDMSARPDLGPSGLRFGNRSLPEELSDSGSPKTEFQENPLSLPWPFHIREGNEGSNSNPELPFSVSHSNFALSLFLLPLFIIKGKKFEDE